MKKRAAFTYRHLDKRLQALGFTVHTQKGKARIYYHEDTGALVTLPDTSFEDEVIRWHLMAARHALEIHDLGELDEMTIGLSEDVDSLTNFKRKTPNFLRRMRKSGRPVVLTINGKAELVVQDAASYQQLLELVDRLEAIKGIRRGLEDVAQGKTKPIAKVRQEKKKKYGL